jgi:hypothetical protein
VRIEQPTASASLRRKAQQSLRLATCPTTRARASDKPASRARCSAARASAWSGPSQDGRSGTGPLSAPAQLKSPSQKTARSGGRTSASAAFPAARGPSAGRQLALYGRAGDVFCQETDAQRLAQGVQGSKFGEPKQVASAAAPPRPSRVSRSWGPAFWDAAIWVFRWRCVRTPA